MFKIGDFVVYRQLTVCKIEGIDTPSFENDKTKKYYILSSAHDSGNGTTVYIPVASEDVLRPIATKEEAQAELDKLPSLNPTVCTLKKPPQLTAYYQEILSSGELLRNLSLLKEITKKEKTVKRLSEIDVRFRAKTEKLLCEELALSLSATPQAIKEILQKSI